MPSVRRGALDKTTKALHSAECRKRIEEAASKDPEATQRLDTAQRRQGDYLERQVAADTAARGRSAAPETPPTTAADAPMEVQVNWAVRAAGLTALVSVGDRVQ